MTYSVADPSIARFFLSDELHSDIGAETIQPSVAQDNEPIFNYSVCVPIGNNTQSEQILQLRHKTDNHKHKTISLTRY